MCQVSERRPNVRRASAACALIMLASVAAPINRDAQAASPSIGPVAPSVGAVSIAAPPGTKSSFRGAVEPVAVRFPPLAASHPRRLDGPVAEVIVRILGSVCTGTPITGTLYVVTAAHCVLTPRGRVIQRSVERDGVRYPAVAVVVDTHYVDRPSAELDAAVLIMAEPIPGPSASIGAALPDSGEVTLAGLQPIDSDGSLLRGHGLHDRPLPKGATGSLIEVKFGPAGCVVPVGAIEVSAARVMVPCGLIPGASGGGLYDADNGRFKLVGILSTVTADLSANGIVPLASLQELVQHPDRYTHQFATEQLHHEQVLRQLT
jgi:hypothetical protein